MDDILEFPKDALVGIRAIEIAMDLVVARKDDLGILLMSNAEIWIGLIVLEETVVARLILLDEVVFEQEGIDLGGDNSKPEIVDMADEHLDFGSMVVVAHEIRTDATLEILGLANINHLASLIQMLIDARCFGDGLQLEKDVVDILINTAVYQDGNGLV